MSDRKNLKVNPTTKDRFDALKKVGETTDGLLHRAFDALEAGGDDQYPGAPRCTECRSVAHAWTVEGGNLVCGGCADGEIDLE